MKKKRNDEGLEYNRRDQDGSSMSDEKDRERKLEENEERRVHSGMKGAACVSLCCTKQSQA